MSVAIAIEDAPPQRSLAARAGDAIRRNPTIAIGAAMLLALVAVAVLAPLIAGDPFRQAPINRMRPPSERWWFGTDQFGRDIFSRTVYGARVSLTVGLSVALLSSLIGLAIGLACGYFRTLDAVLMRVMDGVMAIPSILLAIALITLTRPGLGVVIVAIVIPEVPRVARVVRSVVLSIRGQPYVESAIAGGTRSMKLLVRHILPNTLAPLIVQGDLCLRLGDADRGRPELPRRRRAARDPELGQHHRAGADLLPDRALVASSFPAPSWR